MSKETNLNSPVVSRSVVSISRAEERPSLCPTVRKCRISAVESEETELVAGCPAEAGAVCQENLAVMIERRRPLVDGSVYTLPIQERLREHAGGANRGGRVHGRDAQGLDVIRETRPDKVVLVLNAEDGGINAPVPGELPSVRESVPGVATA